MILRSFRSKKRS